MNDNEIIKALECCVKSRNTDAYCHECPYRNYGYCLDKMMSDAIFLINRQKAEIERLKSMNQSMLDMIHDLRAENERLNKAIDNYEACLKSVEIIKANAIKEFAERLKDEAETTWWFDDEEQTKVCTERLIPVSVMGEIVKEMTGEINENI